MEEDQYFTDTPKIIPLFEVDILQTLTTYIEDKKSEIPVDEQTLKELRLQQEATEMEMKLSQRVHASALQELNLADTNATPRTILIAKEMLSNDKEELKKPSVQGCLCLVIRRHESIRSSILSTPNKFTQGCKTGPATSLLTKSKLCGEG